MHISWNLSTRSTPIPRSKFTCDDRVSSVGSLCCPLAIARGGLQLPEWPFPPNRRSETRVCDARRQCIPKTGFLAVDREKRRRHATRARAGCASSSTGSISDRECRQGLSSDRWANSAWVPPREELAAFWDACHPTRPSPVEPSACGGIRPRRDLPRRLSARGRPPMVEPIAATAAVSVRKRLVPCVAALLGQRGSRLRAPSPRLEV
jgi:hypothetical protein